MTRIIDIVDNRGNDGFQTEHGLSLLIEIGDERILFDTGAGVALVPNAAKLCIDLTKVSRIVLSHSHYDHTGGLGLLKPTCVIHAGKDIEVPSFSKQPDEPVHPLGIPDNSLTVIENANVKITQGLSQITPDIWLNGPIPRVDSLEHVRGFFYDKECTYPSRVFEEQALLTADGVLVTGCCHSGIINTVESFKNYPGLPTIRTIVGGLHLCWANEQEVTKVADYLNKLNLEKVIMLHCTGETAGEILKSRLKCSVEWGAAGQEWEFPGKRDRYDFTAERKLVGREFVHFNGGHYRLEGFAQNSETLETMVVYRALYGECCLWVRPAKMFFEIIKRDGKAMKRFALITSVTEEIK